MINHANVVKTTKYTFKQEYIDSMPGFVGKIIDFFLVFLDIFPYQTFWKHSIKSLLHRSIIALDIIAIYFNTQFQELMKLVDSLDK